MAALADMLTAALARGDAAAVDAAWNDTLRGASTDAARTVAANSTSDLPLDLLHDLMLSPSHHLHQQVARMIQGRADPESLPVIKRVLDQGFEPFAYTCSEDSVIAKWFSHILASIGTPDAVGLISHYAESKNEGVAAEMGYRLGRLNERDRT